MTTSLSHDTRELAETYDRQSDSQFAGGKRLVERLGLASDARVLDVGCGTGRLARRIAESVAPAGRVVGIDPLAERVAIARAHAPALTFETALLARAQRRRAKPRDGPDRVSGLARASMARPL